MDNPKKGVFVDYFPNTETTEETPPQHPAIVVGITEAGLLHLNAFTADTSGENPVKLAVSVPQYKKGITGHYWNFAD